MQQRGPNQDPRAASASTSRVLFIAAGIVMTLILILAIPILLIALTPNPVSGFFKQQAFWTHNIQGNRYAEAGDYQHAVDEYTAMIALRPDRIDGYTLRGNAYMEWDRPEPAIRDYTKGMTIPTIPEAHGDFYFNRGTAYERLGQFERAVADYRESVRIYPPMKSVHFHLMKAYLGAKKYPESIAEATRALATGQGDPKVVHLGRAGAEDELGQTAAALTDVAWILKMNPSDPNAWTDRGWFEYELGRLPDAIRSDRKAVSLNSRDAIPRLNLGLAYAVDGDESHAREAYDSARKLASEANRAAARKDLNRALARHPNRTVLLQKALGWLSP